MAAPYVVDPDIHRHGVEVRPVVAHVEPDPVEAFLERPLQEIGDAAVAVGQGVGHPHGATVFGEPV